MHDSFRFAPEAFLKNELLWWIERLKITRVLDVIRRVSHEDTRGTTAKRTGVRYLLSVTN